VDIERVERFLAAAERDYEAAVYWVWAMVEGDKADGPLEMVQARADVLAALAMVEVAQQELETARLRKEREDGAPDEEDLEAAWDWAEM
jgi:hypothetical protein